MPFKGSISNTILCSIHHYQVSMSEWLLIIFLSLSNEYNSRYDCTVCVLMMTWVRDLLLHVMNSSHADKSRGTKCVSYSCLASLSVKQINTGVKTFIKCVNIKRPLNICSDNYTKNKHHNLIANNSNADVPTCRGIKFIF